MTGRFVALFAPSRPADDLFRLVKQKLTGWQRVVETPRLLVLTEPAATVIPCDGGVILGAMFPHGSPQRLVELAEQEQRAISASAGARLTEIYWGAYVALLSDGASELSIVRAPFGDLPCYWIVIADKVVAFASDVELLRLLAPAHGVEWAALGRYLAAPDCLGAETCLAGVNELRGGNRLTFGRDAAATETILWSPWTVTSALREIVDQHEAAARVRDAVRLSVAARTSGMHNLLLLLSGGLDSSIVAASLKHAGRRFACMTLVSDGAAGDERDYARQVSDSLGVSLFEAHRDLTRINIERSNAAGLPRPTARCFAQESDRLAALAVNETGAEAILDGGGGDNVFYGYLSVAPVADRWMAEGASAGFWASVGAIGALAQTSRLTVARRGIVRAWRPPSPHRPIDVRFLSKDARAAATAAAIHPWLVAPPGMQAGKASQVAGLAPAQALVESADPRAPVASVAPLVTQLVAETCLRVPSWAWFERANNRMIARRAFAADLPERVIGRRSKGSPSGFVAAIFETRRQQVREFLMGGALAANDVLDTASLTAALDDSSPTVSFEFTRIMQLVDAEAWARSWN